MSLEGGEGSGKSTQAALLRDWLTQRDLPVVCVREPGSTPVGEELRQILVGPADGSPSITPWAEALMYTAARAQLVDEVIKPALGQGLWVLADRYIDSTLAYQGYGLGLPLAALRSLNAAATGDLWPNLTILFDVHAPEGLTRSRAAGQPADRVEVRGPDFHTRVNQGYLELSRAEPKRWVVIPAQAGIETVHAQVIHAVSSLLEEVQP